MPRNFIAASLVALTLAACATTSGGGTGASPDGIVTATFDWRDKDANTGEMTARLNSGERFTGPYFQVTHEGRVETYAPLWTGWDHPLIGTAGEWRSWASTDQFVTKYTGRVLANLAGADGRHMRCAFRLKNPMAGLSQGGLGRCQLPDGRSIDAAFPMP